jgi:hypothetical protein
MANIPEDSKLHTRCCENLKSHKVNNVNIDTSACKYTNPTHPQQLSLLVFSSSVFVMNGCWVHGL